MRKKTKKEKKSNKREKKNKKKEKKEKKSSKKHKKDHKKDKKKGKEKTKESAAINQNEYGIYLSIISVRNFGLILLCTHTYYLFVNCRQIWCN